jgi:uncharacterized protein YkwD
MRSLCFTLVVLCAPVVWAAEGTAPPEKAATPAVQPKPRQLHEHPTLVHMLHANNSIRGRLGLRPHRMNPALTLAAQDHANYMARTGQFSHYTNGGPQYRASRYGFRGGVRENIAWNPRSVDGAFAMWQGSPPHMASIMSGTSDAGFGYAVASNGTTYWVAVYGTAPAPVAVPYRTTAAKPVQAVAGK